MTPNINILYNDYKTLSLKTNLLYSFSFHRIRIFDPPAPEIGLRDVSSNVYS